MLKREKLPVGQSMKLAGIVLERRRRGSPGNIVLLVFPYHILMQRIYTRTWAGLGEVDEEEREVPGGSSWPFGNYPKLTGVRMHAKKIH